MKIRITNVEIFMLKHAGTTSPYGPYKPVVVKVNTDTGIYGLGEAGVSMGIGEHALAGMLMDIAPYYIGRNPMDNEVIWEEMRTKINGHISGGGAVYYGSLSAFDTALTDIKGKALNIPVYQLLGGKQNDDLRCYYSMMQAGTGGDLSPRGTAEEYAQTAEKIMNAGFDAAKIAPLYFDRDKSVLGDRRIVTPLTSYSLNLMEERLKAIRDVGGKGFDIIVEYFCSLDSRSAIQADAVAARYGVFYCEEPVLPMKRKLFKSLHENTHVPLATGEKIHTRWQYSDLFEDSSVDIIQPDISNCGGISETKKICDMAHIYGVKAQIHIAGTPIATAAALQVEAAIPNFFIHEYFYLNEAAEYADYCTCDYKPVNGKIKVPDLPGIGQDLSDKAVAEALSHIVID